MDLKKRILSLVLALVLVLSCVSVFAEEATAEKVKITINGPSSIDWVCNWTQGVGFYAYDELGNYQGAKWSLSNTTVLEATFDAHTAGDVNATYKVLAPGKVTITATPVDEDGKVIGDAVTKEFEAKEIKTEKIEIKPYMATTKITLGDNGEYVYDLADVVITPDNSSYRFDLSYSSSDTSVVRIEKDGNLIPVKAGDATITVTTKDGKSATLAVKVVEEEDPTAITSLKFNADKYYFNFSEGGARMYWYLTAEPADASWNNVVWSVDDTSIATIAQNGRLTFNKAGTVKVTATAGTVSATCTVIINEMESFTMAFAQKEVTLKLWDSFTPSLVFTPADAEYGWINYKSSNSDVVSIEYDEDDGSVYLWAAGAGKATITATAIRNDVIMATATCEITVEETPIKSISFTENEYKANYGEYGLSLYDKLVFDPINNRVDVRELVWTSSDITIASVDSDGDVYFLKPGTAKITVKLAADESISASTYVTIDAIALQKVKFEDKQYIMGFTASENEDVHTYLSIAPIYTPANAFIKNVRFESTNANVATAESVLSSGNTYIKVQANGLGKAVITAYFDDGVETKEASFTVVVTDKITKVKLNKTKKTLYMKPKALRTYQLVAKDATTRAKFGADMIKWKSSNKKVATVDENGLVTAKGVGTCTITATVKDKLKKTATCKITVKKKKNLK